MSAELISILVLVVVFVIATTRSINMGALAFAAAFGVGELVADLDADGIFAGFPGDLFVVLVGVTYLFAIARANGTTDWLVHASIRLVGGRIALIPWVMFVITGALTAIGAVSPAAVAIVAPIALSFAARYGISPLLMGAMVVHGAQGGGFSPISIYGSIVNGIVERENLPGNETLPVPRLLGRQPDHRGRRLRPVRRPQAVPPPCRSQQLQRQHRRQHRRRRGQAHIPGVRGGHPPHPAPYRHPHRPCRPGRGGPGLRPRRGSHRHHPRRRAQRLLARHQP